MLFGVLTPILILHSIFGLNSYIDADMYTCREKHGGEVLYILSWMFAVFTSVVLVGVFSYIVVPGLIQIRYNKNLNSEGYPQEEERVVFDEE